jgi:hypothetical protein
MEFKTGTPFLIGERPAYPGAPKGPAFSVESWPDEPRRGSATHAQRKAERVAERAAAVQPASNGWSTWIMCDQPKGCPIPTAMAGDYEIILSDGAMARPVCHAENHGAWAPIGLDIFGQGGNPLRIVAYRLKRTSVGGQVAAVAPPPPIGEDWCVWDEGDAVPSCDRVDIIRVAAGIKGASLSQIDNVATVSQYWGPGSFVRKWRPAAAPALTGDPNANMINRDGGATKRYWSDVGGAATYAKTLMQAYERNLRDSALVANAFTEHGSDHRLGLWGNYSL